MATLIDLTGRDDDDDEKKNKNYERNGISNRQSAIKKKKKMVESIFPLETEEYKIPQHSCDVCSNYWLIGTSSMCATEYTYTHT